METEPYSPRKQLLNWSLILITTGCAGFYLWFTAYFTDLNASQKRDNQVIGPLDGEHSYLQSFKSSTPGLSLLEVPLFSVGSGGMAAGSVDLHLQDCHHNNVASASYKLPTSSQEFNIRFKFPAQNDSLNRIYCLLIQSNAPPETVYVLGSEYDLYADGELQVNGAPTKQDLAFFSYSRPSPFFLIADTLRSSLPRFGSVLLMTIIVFAWGYGVSSLALPQGNITERIIYTLMIGISLPSILFFLLILLGVKLEKDLLIAIGAGLLLVSIVARLVSLKKRPFQIPNKSQITEALFILALLFVVTFTRMAQIKDLIVPSGIGTQTHERILEKIQRTQEVPLSSVYHTGFHSNAIFLHLLLTSQSLPETMLLYGQWLSIVSGLPLYLLARKLIDRPLGAVMTTVLYWFVSPIPAFFFNISRYPFLQGMVLMPAILLFFWDGVSNRSGNSLPVILLMIGLLLTHIGSFIITGVILLAIYLSILRGLQQLPLRQLIRSALVIFIPVFIVAIIKLYFVAQDGTWSSFLNQPALQLATEDYSYSFGETLQQGGPILWMLGLAGSVILVTRKRKFALIAITVAVALLVLDRVQIALLGRSASNLTDLLFCLAIPLSLLSGYLLSNIRLRDKLAGPLMVAVVVLMGSYNISALTNPKNVFFSEADQKALAWIDKNTSPESIFLVNSYPWDGNCRPTDGGFWIPSFTGREIVFPDSKLAEGDVQKLIVRNGVDYVYLGSGYGTLTPFDMTSLSLVYNEEGIYIYKRKK